MFKNNDKGLENKDCDLILQLLFLSLKQQIFPNNSRKKTGITVVAAFLAIFSLLFFLVLHLYSKHTFSCCKVTTTNCLQPSKSAHGLPMRKSSFRWMLCFRVLTLLSSPIKFTVKSSFVSHSHPVKIRRKREKKKEKNGCSNKFVQQQTIDGRDATFLIF